MGETRPTIVDLRKAAGLTRAQVARALGVEARNVARWERWGSMPNRGYRVRLAALFGVSPRVVDWHGDPN